MIYNDPLIGRKVKDFEIVERIGQGGMAVVYRAHQTSVNRDVALKIIDVSHADDPNAFRQRFAQEAKLVASLEHIHILPVYDYGILDDRAFLAMRYLRGGSIQELLYDGGLPIEHAADLFKQFASGLTYAHRKGVIHRDLKPSNVMLDDAGNAYLTDFGLAKIAGDSLEITRDKNIVGTPSYMSPEQLRGEKLTPRSDIYSLGVVLFRILTCQLPYESTSTEVVSIIYQILEKDPVRPSLVRSDIPQSVEQVILKALSKKPQDRYDTPDAMAKALNYALGRGSSSDYPVVPRPSSTSISIQLPSSAEVKRYRWPFTAILLTIAVVIIGLVIYFGDEEKEVNSSTLTAPTVLVGESALSSEIIPTELEIQRAQRYLGDSFIGYMACNQDSEYHATYAREVRDLATRYGLALRIYDGKSDPYEQTLTIERARADGAIALIVCPLDEKLLDPVLTSAKEDGIRLVIGHNEVDSYGGVKLGGDNYLLGYNPGLYAGEIVRDELDGKANVLVLDFPDLVDIVVRATGMEEGLLENAPDAQIVGHYKGGTREFAQESIAQAIADGVEFDVILSINDAGTFGAINALEAAGIPDDAVMIFSVDAETLAREYIQEGHYIRASVETGRRESAEASVNAMVKLLAGATIPEIIRTEPGQLITQDTVG